MIINTGENIFRRSELVQCADLEFKNKSEPLVVNKVCHIITDL